MEGATYAQTTFGDVLNHLEKAEQQTTSTEQATTTIDTPQADNTTQADAAATTEGAAQTQVADESVSQFDISMGDETAAATEEKVQPSFNLDEEIKKVDTKELLKKLGISEFAIEIDQHIKSGGQPIDYLQAKAVDYNKITDDALLKDDLRKQYPQFDARQIDLMFNRKYGVSDDALDEDKEFATLQLQADAYKIRQTKIAEQQKFKISDTPIPQKDEAYEQWKQNREQIATQAEQVRDFYLTHEATKKLNESKRVAISLGENVPPFNFNIDKPELITKAFTDDGTIWRKLTSTPQGEPDVAKQQLIALFTFNPQKFIQEVFNYGKQRGGRHELVEEGQNAQRPQAKVATMQTDDVQNVTVKKFSDIGR